jgi:uncharacterized protein YqjF (DUF2071 family)
MESYQNILNTNKNRQYPLPDSSWQHYQEWHGNIMLHWKVDAEQLRKCIPAGLELDLFEGDAYVSVIAFSVRKLHPRGIPPLPGLSSFHETNLRTYVVRDGKPGIFFLNIDASRSLPVSLARMLTKLPYRKAQIDRVGHLYNLKGKGSRLNIRYVPKEIISRKSALDKWLTERHCLYELDGKRLFRIDIHHKPWKLRSMLYVINDVEYAYCEGLPVLVHYAHKIRVLLWSKKYL